jgi:hypothetical protein
VSTEDFDVIVLGAEMPCAYASLGAKVTVVEALPRLIMARPGPRGSPSTRTAG